MVNKSILKKGQAEEGREVCVEPAINPCDLPLAVPGGADYEDELEGGPGFSGSLDSDPGETEFTGSDADLAVAEARYEAAAILARARDESQKITAEAQAEAARFRDAAEREINARREALEREVAAALGSEYAGRYLAAICALEAAAQELRDGRREQLKALEQDAFQLVLAIARQLLGAEPERNPGFLAALIARAFLLLNPDQAAQVHLHPETYERLTQDPLLLEALGEAGIRPERIALEPDQTLSPDQFSLRVNGVSIDYDLTESLGEIIEHLEHSALGYEEGGAAAPADAS